MEYVPFSRYQEYYTPCLFQCAHQPPYGVGAFLILTLQARTLSFREVKSPVEGHPALKQGARFGVQTTLAL